MSPSRDANPQLSPADARVLDALAEHGYDPAALEAQSPEDRRRAQSIMSLLHALDDYPVEDADDTLVYATLARIDRVERERGDRLSIEAERQRAAGAGRRWFRVPDFISVAAVMLLGVSLGWPLINEIRQQSMDSRCDSNLRMVAQGFASYASDYNNAMPASFATAGLGGLSGWDNARNYDNLAPLVNGGYCDEGHLNCPGHCGIGPSYSYQHQTPGVRSMWESGQAQVVFGDRNPIVDAVRIGQPGMPSLSLSLNHGRRGQNVIQHDGSTSWLIVPRVGHDNIWLPNGVIYLQRGDMPRDLSDVFLTH